MDTFGLQKANRATENNGVNVLEDMQDGSHGCASLIFIQVQALTCP